MADSSDMYVPWLSPLSADGDDVHAMRKPGDSGADTCLDHFSQLDIKSESTRLRQTGIICTIGPSSRTIQRLEEMLEAGMVCARINMAYNNHEYHKETIRNIREAVSNHSKKINRIFPLAIAVDTKGPQIRTGKFEGNPEAVEIKKGDKIKLTMKTEWKDRGNSRMIYADYESIKEVVKSGNRMYVDYGNIILTVKDVGQDSLTCRVEKGGLLSSYRPIYVPDVLVRIPNLSANDEDNIWFAVEHNVDIIFASFVYNSALIKKIRETLGDKGRSLMVIAKIENAQALGCIDEIISASDGVAIVRRSLSVELPHEKVALAQKVIIAKCNKIGKPVICATQILESMVREEHPSRNEVTDVMNAVFDGADCLMLSSETSVGKHVVPSIRQLDKICREAEHSICYMHFTSEVMKLNPVLSDPVNTVVKAAIQAAGDCNASAVVCTTTSGHTGQLLCRYRLQCPVICVTRYGHVARQLQLWRSCLPVQYISEPIENFFQEIDARVRCGINIGKQYELIRAGDAIVSINCWHGNTGFNNTMRIIYAAETI